MVAFAFYYPRQAARDAIGYRTGKTAKHKGADDYNDDFEKLKFNDR